MNPDLAPGALQKPSKGTALLERRAKRQHRDAFEKSEKAAVMARDGHQCRWPRCAYRTKQIPIEVAHLFHKGRGGNPAMDRSERRKMLALCRLHHQGAISLDSKDLRVEILTADGTDGPLAFYRRSESGRWDCIGIESRIGTSVTRDAR